MPSTPNTAMPLTTSEDAYEAFEYAFPVYEMAKLRWRALEDRAHDAWTSAEGCPGERLDHTGGL